jgi:hypothetical protein
MDMLAILAILVAFAYIILYLRGSSYKREGFEGSCKTVLDTSYQSKPYMTNEHQYGDFEQDFVYQNEGGFDTTREAIDAARRRFPFDWAGLPPSSALFQAQQALFSSDKGKTAAPFVSETFADLDAKKALPPDEYGQVTEDDILKAYKARETKNMKVVDEKGVKRLINDIYGSKGLVAKVAKKANNVFEVYEVQEKNPKIVWEDEVSSNSSMQDNALNPMVDPSETLIVPSGAGDIGAGVTPNASGENTRLSKREYSDYNPNLQGIFGEKMQWQQWG